MKRNSRVRVGFAIQPAVGGTCLRLSTQRVVDRASDAGASRPLPEGVAHSHPSIDFAKARRLPEGGGESPPLRPRHTLGIRAPNDFRAWLFWPSLQRVLLRSEQIHHSMREDEISRSNLFLLENEILYAFYAFQQIVKYSSLFLQQEKEVAH